MERPAFEMSTIPVKKRFETTMRFDGSASRLLHIINQFDGLVNHGSNVTCYEIVFERKHAFIARIVGACIR